MNDYELPDDYHHEQQEREQYERYRQEQIDNCTHGLILEDMEERWIDGSASWFAFYYCEQCEVGIEMSVDEDDYLTWKDDEA